VLALGYELVGCIEFRQGRKLTLRIYIDREHGITVDDCQIVSHQLSGIFAVAEPIPGDYILEVSSPGVDRPLFTLEHFLRFSGHRARIRLRAPLKQQRNYSAILQGVEADKVILRLDDGEDIFVPFNQIERANLTPDLFK
jgi:ribosome maturation factor RimP